jgi:hypothetical protein
VYAPSSGCHINDNGVLGGVPNDTLSVSSLNSPVVPYATSVVDLLECSLLEHPDRGFSGGSESDNDRSGVTGHRSDPGGAPVQKLEQCIIGLRVYSPKVLRHVLGPCRRSPSC